MSSPTGTFFSMVTGSCGTPPSDDGAAFGRSVCRSWYSTRRTTSWCRGGRSRGCDVRYCQDAWVTAARFCPRPVSGSFHPRIRPARVPGGARYRPTISHTYFSMNNGSLDNLNVSERCGAREKALQMRLIDDWLNLHALAMSQVKPMRGCLRLALQSSRQTPRSTCSSLNLRDVPGRG